MKNYKRFKKLSRFHYIKRKKIKRCEKIYIICDGVNLIIKILIFILNIAFLFLNIFLLFAYMKKHKSSNPIFFKNSDIFNFNLFKRTYQNISSYLLNKYNSNNQTFNSNEKKIIKVKQTGYVNRARNLIWLEKRLSDKFILEYDSPNPDYIIYNVYSDEDLKPEYHNIIRIALYTENKIPDLNCADYYFAHYRINYLDRYFKMNIFLWENLDEIDKKRLEVINNPIRKKFCGAAISNCNGLFRLDFIDKLNNYKKIGMGGGCLNNIGARIKDKINFLSEYKFSIAMENSEGDGYISEKIADSFRAGTIPIYYGDYLIDEYINPKTYILIRGEKDIDKKIEYIKKIDNDDKLYMEIMKEKPILDDKFVEKIDDKEIKEFFYNIFSQDKNKAYRRDDNFYDFNNDLICQLKSEKYY